MVRGIGVGSGADLEAFVGVVGLHEDAGVLVCFEHEVGSGGEDAIEGSEAAGDEGGDILEGLSADEEEEVVGAAAHEEGAFDFIEACDTGSDGVEAAFSFGADLDFDDGVDECGGEGFLVQEGLVAADDAGFFVCVDFLGDGFRGRGGHFCDIFEGGAGVIPKDFEQGVHMGSRVGVLWGVWGLLRGYFR